MVLAPLLVVVAVAVLLLVLVLVLAPAIVVLVLAVVELALALVLVGAVRGEVARLPALEAVVASLPEAAVVVEAHEPLGDESKLLIVQFVYLLFRNRKQGGKRESSKSGVSRRSTRTRNQSNSMRHSKRTL